MKKLKVSTLWIIVVLLFLAAIGLIFACAYTDDGMNTFMIVLLAIDFIILTFLIQYVSFRTFKYKPKAIKYPTKEYETNIDICSELRGLKYKERKRNYGNSFLRIVGKSAFKVVLVNDVEQYFNQEEDNNSEPNKDLEKCNKFIGLEIFESIDEESLKKIPDFSIQGENVYYTALVKQDNKYVCLNYIEPSEVHKDNFNTILEDLKLIEVIKEDNAE